MFEKPIFGMYGYGFICLCDVLLCVELDYMHGAYVCVKAH